ncbi:2-hydroxyacid dehydrogenase [Paraburkholderia domus]|uniref:2-hydroxyacid dehydrogenase n=1 Tax=Paraburkholderia domus TaxID=2793075 RepID=UPI001B8BD292|nr:2-hydroxyacid dehydrogenase [Paraburkholderia domus]
MPEWLEIVVVDEADADAACRELEDADVLLHVLTPVTGAVLKAAPKLRLVQKIGVGTNTIDVEVARSLGIAVANMPGTNSQAVAEHTLALMLAALRRVGYLDSTCRRGIGWSLPPDTFDSVSELSGRTVGFVGYGSIPRRLTAALVALGSRVVYYARSAAPDDAAQRLPSLQTLLEQADIVSLHIPLTEDTRGLLNSRAFGEMKRGAVLINTARGELVDERALLDALKSGTIAAAGLDVFATEPATADNPLLSRPNVVATPHVAWLTPQTLERSIGVIVENCRRLRDGEPLMNRV